jgi:hypothetical protein
MFTFRREAMIMTAFQVTPAVLLGLLLALFRVLFVRGG